jgi:hypothetical protein
MEVPNPAPNPAGAIRRATGSPLAFRPLPPPSTPFPHCRRRQRSSGEAWATPAVAAFHSPCLESGSGPSLSWQRCSLGSNGPTRPGGDRAVASRGGTAWRSARAEVATDSSLAMIWATRASNGLGRASNGLGQVRVAEFAVLPRGGDDDCAWFGTVARPACCSRAARALQARLGPAGPMWAWCASGVLSGRRSSIGSGGGFLPPDYGVVVPYPSVVVYPHFIGHALLFSKRL